MSSIIAYINTPALWLAEHSHVSWRSLPAYSGRRRPPSRRCRDVSSWRLKDQIAANRLQRSIDASVVALQAFFAAFPPADALRLAA